MYLCGILLYVRVNVKIDGLIRRLDTSAMIWKYMQGSILVVIQKQHQLIFLSLTAGVVQVKFVATLPLKDGGEKGGAERELGAWQSNRLL